MSKKEIIIKNSWSDVTLDQMKEIELMDKNLSDFEVTCELISILYETDSKELPFPQFQAYAKGLGFFSKPIPNVKLKSTYTLNDVEYELDYDAANFTTGQFQDWSVFSKEENRDLAKFLSVVLIPKGHKYDDGYDMKKVREDILLLPMTDVNAIVSFFSNLSVRYQKVIKYFLNKLLTKQKKNMTEENKKKIDLLKTLLDNFASFPLS